MRAKPLLDDEQWQLVSALEQLGKGANVAPMPGTRVEHWFRGATDKMRDSRLIDSYLTKATMLAVADIIHKMTIPLALVKVETNDDIACSRKYLGLAITDDDRLARYLDRKGVRTLTWPMALDFFRKGQASSLIDIVENIVACGRAALPVKVHVAESLLKSKLKQHLICALPESLDRSRLDDETLTLFREEFKKQSARFSVFRDVAVSRILSVNPGDPVDPDMQRVYDTSDVDFVIHGRAPHNIPLLAIEYDGREHRTDQKKIINDQAKNRLLSAAGIALMRIGTDKARVRLPGQPSRPEHQCLPPMLDLARVILERRIVQHTRAGEDRAHYARLGHDMRSIAHALYGKPPGEIDAEQRAKALSVVQAGYQDVCQEVIADRVAEDLIDDMDSSLTGQLEQHGLDPSCLSDVTIVPTPYGHVGKARLQLDDGSAVRSVTTVPVSLSAPFMPAEAVEHLIQLQIHAELAYLAYVLANATKRSGTVSRLP